MGRMSEFTAVNSRSSRIQFGTEVVEMQTLRSARPETAQHVPQRELAAALRADELALYFQPIVVLGTGRIRGVEALIRWHRPDGTVLVPDDFLPAVADA